jgi:hypothetical protein
VDGAIAELMRAVRDLFDAPAKRDPFKHLLNTETSHRRIVWNNPVSPIAGLASGIRHVEQARQRQPPINPATGLASVIRLMEHAKPRQRGAREDLAKYAELLIRDFESAWQEVAKANYKLKLVLKS